MSTTAKKPPPPSTAGRRPSATPNPPASPASQGWPPSTPPTANGIVRTKSIRGSSGVTRSARATTKRPGPGPTNLSSNDMSTASEDVSEDDAKAETAAVIDELKNRLLKAETASGEYQRQLAILQMRLDESQDDHGRLEERMHEDNERMQALEKEKGEVLRQNRDVEALLDSERMAMEKENNEHNAREEGLLSTIQRLKETLAQRDMRMNLDGDRRLSRSCKQCRANLGWTTRLIGISNSKRTQQRISKHRERPIRAFCVVAAQRAERCFQVDHAERQSHRIFTARTRRSSN